MWASEIIVLMISINAENQWIRSWKMTRKLNFYGGDAKIELRPN